MMSALKVVLLRFCYRLGFYPKKIYSPVATYKYLENKPVAVKEYELRNLTVFISKTRNYNYYQELLRSYISNWSIEISNAKFIGSGIGENSLNSFRKVTAGERTYFEKVYFNSFGTLELIGWFQQNVYTHIRHKITVPQLQVTYCGDLISVAYYEFLELSKIPASEEESVLIRFSKDLYEISFEALVGFPLESIPESVMDFRNHFEYRRNIGIAERKLKEQQVNSNDFETAVSGSKRIITHGDLQATNAFNNSVLIDWDAFGIFPIGFDPAFLYFRLMVKDQVLDNFSDWLSKHYRTVIRDEDWADFNKNCIFFVFVFATKLFDHGRFKDLEVLLIEKLRKY